MPSNVNLNLKKNSVFSLVFWKSLLFVQNKWHQHGVFIHTLRVFYYTLKARDFTLLATALFHDIGKPFVAYVKDDEDREFNEYSFTDHEEMSYQIVKNWFFLSEHTKKLIRYHYLIRDIKKSKEENIKRYRVKKVIWENLDEHTQKQLNRFLLYDDLGKGKKRR